MPEKRPHQLNIHLTEKQYEEMDRRRLLRGFKTPSAYFISLMAMETIFLAQGPCEECRLVQTLVPVVKVVEEAAKKLRPIIQRVKLKVKNGKKKK